MRSNGNNAPRPMSPDQVAARAARDVRDFSRRAQVQVAEVWEYWQKGLLTDGEAEILLAAVDGAAREARTLLYALGCGAAAAEWEAREVTER